MGVWIETSRAVNMCNGGGSHPVWVCGLKHRSTQSPPNDAGSHPVWVCGLKLAIVIYMLYNILSHPVWVCGLKLMYGVNHLSKQSHTLYGCVD